MPFTLRPYRPGDGPLLYEAARESIPDMYPFMPWCHSDYQIEEAEEWVESRQRRFVEGTEFDFVISDGQAFLGGCGLNQIDQPNRRANLGYWVRSSARNRGAATTAVKLLAKWAFQSTTLIRLEIVVAVENHASLRVAEKAGAVREGILRSRLLLYGEAHDAVMFSVVRGTSMVAASGTEAAQS